MIGPGRYRLYDLVHIGVYAFAQFLLLLTEELFDKPLDIAARSLGDADDQIHVDIGALDRGRAVLELRLVPRCRAYPCGSAQIDMDISVAVHARTDTRALRVVAAPEYRSPFFEPQLFRGFRRKSGSYHIRTLDERRQFFHIQSGERKHGHPLFLFKIEPVAGSAAVFGDHLARALEFQKTVDVEKILGAVVDVGTLFFEPDELRYDILAHYRRTRNEREQPLASQFAHYRTRLFLRSAVDPRDVVVQYVAPLVDRNDAHRLRGKDDTLDVLGIDLRVFDDGSSGSAYRLPVFVGILLHEARAGIVSRIGSGVGGDDPAVEIDEHRLIGTRAHIVRDYVSSHNYLLYLRQSR